MSPDDLRKLSAADKLAELLKHPSPLLAQSPKVYTQPGSALPSNSPSSVHGTYFHPVGPYAQSLGIGGLASGLPHHYQVLNVDVQLTSEIYNPHWDGILLIARDVFSNLPSGPEWATAMSSEARQQRSKPPHSGKIELSKQGIIRLCQEAFQESFYTQANQLATGFPTSEPVVFVRQLDCAQNHLMRLISNHNNAALEALSRTDHNVNSNFSTINDTRLAHADYQPDEQTFNNTYKSMCRLRAHYQRVGAVGPTWWPDFCAWYDRVYADVMGDVNGANGDSGASDGESQADEAFQVDGDLDGGINGPAPLQHGPARQGDDDEDDLVDLNPYSTLASSEEPSHRTKRDIMLGLGLEHVQDQEREDFIRMMSAERLEDAHLYTVSDNGDVNWQDPNAHTALDTINLPYMHRTKGLHRQKNGHHPTSLHHQWHQAKAVEDTLARGFSSDPAVKLGDGPMIYVGTNSLSPTGWVRLPPGDASTSSRPITPWSTSGS